MANPFRASKLCRGVGPTPLLTCIERHETHSPQIQTGDRNVDLHGRSGSVFFTGLSVSQAHGWWRVVIYWWPALLHSRVSFQVHLVRSRLGFTDDGSGSLFDSGCDLEFFRIEATWSVAFLRVHRYR